MSVGFTVGTRYGFITAADYAHSVGATCIQLFLRSAHSYVGKRKTAGELDQLRDRLEHHQMEAVVHGCYLLNFCNPPGSYIHEKAVVQLSEDLTDAVRLGAIGVVIHMGKKLKMDKGVALKNYLTGIQRALNNADPRSRLILETGTGCGTEICTPLIKLGMLRRMVPKRLRGRIGFCLDTCHMFVAGSCLGFEECIRLIDNEVDKFLGWENVDCIHLNDSKAAQFSSRDLHADLGKGLIGLDGLSSFCRLAASHNIPLILETPAHYYNTKNEIYKFSKKDKKTKQSLERIKKAGYTRYTCGQQMRLVREWLSTKYVPFCDKDDGIKKD